MTWTRLDDAWTERADLAELSHADRWHYLGMIQRCSRTGNQAGILRAVDAERASDHPNPSDALEHLTERGILQRMSGDRYRLVEIEDYLPSAATIRRTEQARERQRRKRAHDAGDHSQCRPGTCEDAPGEGEQVSGEREGVSRSASPVSRRCHAPVTRDKTRDVGTGRDGTGRDYGSSDFRSLESVTDWDTVTPGEAPVEEPRAEVRAQTRRVFGAGYREAS